MKKISKLLLTTVIVATTGMIFTSCIDETEPTSVATVDQIAESTSAAEANLMGLPAMFNLLSSTFEDIGWHFPFGYGAIMHIRDLMTGDMYMSVDNYASHFIYWAQNQYQGDGYVFCQYIFNYYYSFIMPTNNLIGGINPETANETQLGYLGAGLAFRSLLYLDMARMYEFLPNDIFPDGMNMDGNVVTNLTVPIVKDGMALEEVKNNPRATREDMAAFIEEDLNNAEKYIVYLNDTKGGTLPDLSCVYGLKARLYMWLEDYKQAKKYADMAISSAVVDPMTEDECTNYQTGFNDISKWMWGAQMTSEDDVVQSGIINWVSWLSNQTTFGYTGFAESNMPFNCIDDLMYARISDTDFRKLLFKAPEGSSLADKVIQIPDMKENADEFMPAMAAVKFRPKQGNATDYQTGAASAYPIMRVEEMYFIKAEAAAHENAAEGKTILQDFMKNYRDPDYTCSVSSTDDVVEEIVFQKRVELWGEGHTFFDVKRLNMSVTRGYPGTKWLPLTRFNTNGRPAWMNFVLIKTEGNNNPAVVGWNNPDPSDAYTPWTESK
jgi:hypothetical protein